MMDDLFARVRDAQDAELESSSVCDAVEPRVLEAAGRSAHAHGHGHAREREPIDAAAGRSAHAAARAPKPRARPVWPLIAASVAAAVVLLAIGSWAGTRAPEAAISYDVTQGAESVFGFVGAHGEGAAIAFSDGSHVTLDEGALRVVSLDAHGAAIALERGALTASVVHREDTSWRVYAGPFAVLVTGTRFRSEWDPHAAALHVAVEEGSVRVEGSCLAEPRSVSAGEDVHLTCPGWEETELASAESTSVVATEVSTAHETSPETVARPTRTERALDRESHEIEEAVPTTPVVAQAVVAQAVAPEPTPAPEAAERLELAQRAALAGDIAAAEREFRRLRDDLPHTDQAALAAFFLGRLAFDEQHDYDAAARWFETYGEERPAGGLAREALGRELEARTRAGDPTARDVALRYLARYPDGPHAARAREIERRTPTE